MNARDLSAIIVDDSVQARKLLRLMIREIASQVQIVGEAVNVPDAVLLIQSVNPDIVFLDIDMPGKSGLQLVEEISRETVPYEIIFTTAYNEYALRAFRLAAIDYLLKPIEESQLAEAVKKVSRIKFAQQNETRLRSLIQNLQNSKDSTISIPALNGYIYVRVADILYVKASGSYAEVFLSGKSPLIVSKNLKYFEQALDSFPHFFRVHRSYLINTHQMKRFDKAERGKIVMNDEAQIDLARDRRDMFFALMK